MSLNYCRPILFCAGALFAVHLAGCDNGSGQSGNTAHRFVREEQLNGPVKPPATVLLRLEHPAAASPHTGDSASIGNDTVTVSAPSPVRLCVPEASDRLQPHSVSVNGELLATLGHEEQCIETQQAGETTISVAAGSSSRHVDQETPVFLQIASPANRSLDSTDELITILVTHNSCPGCELQGADLSGLSFIGTNLQAANLDNASLNGTSFTNMIASYASFAGASFRNATVVQADFTGAVFANALISDSSLQTLQMTDAVLTGARVARTRLSESVLTGANLRDASFLLSEFTGNSFEPTAGAGDAAFFFSVFDGNRCGPEPLQNMCRAMVTAGDYPLCGPDCRGAEDFYDIRGLSETVGTVEKGLQGDLLALFQIIFSTRSQWPTNVVRASFNLWFEYEAGGIIAAIPLAVVSPAEITVRDDWRSQRCLEARSFPCVLSEAITTSSVNGQQGIYYMKLFVQDDAAHRVLLERIIVAQTGY